MDRTEIDQPQEGKPVIGYLNWMGERDPAGQQHLSEQGGTASHIETPCEPAGKGQT